MHEYDHSNGGPWVVNRRVVILNMLWHVYSLQPSLLSSGHVVSGAKGRLTDKAFVIVRLCQWAVGGACCWAATVPLSAACLQAALGYGLSFNNEQWL